MSFFVFLSPPSFVLRFCASLSTTFAYLGGLQGVSVVEAEAEAVGFIRC